MSLLETTGFFLVHLGLYFISSLLIQYSTRTRVGLPTLLYIQSIIIYLLRTVLSTSNTLPSTHPCRPLICGCALLRMTSETKTCSAPRPEGTIESKLSTVCWLVPTMCSISEGVHSRYYTVLVHAETRNTFHCLRTLRHHLCSTNAGTVP